VEKIIVYINDATHALAQIAPMKGQTPAGSNDQGRTHWILVACAPRVSQHVSKWLTYSARENFRAKWSESLFAEITPLLATGQDTVQGLVVRQPLVQMTETLLRQHGAARVLDARLALVGQHLPPVTQNQPEHAQSRWTIPGALVGMGTVMALASE
jgi:hypothetical protein